MTAALIGLTLPLASIAIDALLVTERPKTRAPIPTCEPEHMTGKWFYGNPHSKAIDGCGITEGDNIWRMLKAYRSGGTERIHWKYEGDTDPSLPDCMENWCYFAANGIALHQGPVAKYMNSKDGKWCALPVYFPGGGTEGLEWEVCDTVDDHTRLRR